MFLIKQIYSCSDYEKGRRYIKARKDKEHKNKLILPVALVHLLEKK